MIKWGFLSIIVSACLGSLATSCCPNSCSGHGTCSNSGNGCLCTCFKGYIGGDCSRRECPAGSAWNDVAVATDRAHLPAVCSNRGTCDHSAGKCVCDPGFTGLACNRLTCPGDCSKHGECRSLKYHAFRKDKGDGSPVRYDSNWDSEMIYGCVCDEGYEGGDCSRRRCAIGDDPLTGAATDAIFGFQKNEKQTVSCAATGGTFTLSFKGQTTVPINFNDKADVVATKLEALSTIVKVNVFYAGTSTTFCTADGNIVTIEFTQNFGSLPLLVGDSKKLLNAGVGSQIRLLINKAEEGTKENETCSNRGRCDQSSGVCNCYNGYTTSDGNGKPGDRGDCGATESSIISCPGDIECSGHGYCSGSPQYRCFCVDGWSSGDCSTRTCPKGIGWFDMPVSDNRAHQMSICSGVGWCDTSKGECVCPVPFEGAACERMKCPGIDSLCNGHGRCLSMAQLAQEARTNGDPILVTYGYTPNNPKTWDYNKIQGCLCDNGFHGHDCSLRSCPSGDDPRTVGQRREVQTIVCKELSEFTLSFRGEKSSTIPWHINAAGLKNALESLKSIDRVTVHFSSGSTACTSDGSNKVTILFETELGDLPALRVDNTNPNLVTIDVDGAGTSVRGTVENTECSNKKWMKSSGLCDYQTGRCNCFTGMASSNGQNALGLREDCGYILPIESLSQSAIQS